MTEKLSSSKFSHFSEITVGSICFPSRWILIGLLLIQTGLIGMMAWRKSPTNDEIAHLPATVLYLQYQRFELYRVNPPLARLVAGLPVVLAGCNTDWSSFDPSVGTRTEWEVGYDFVTANPDRYLWLMFLARLGCLPFAWAGTLILWAWSKQLGSLTAAIISTSLWVFSPTVLGNAAILTCDVPATTMGLLAAWRFYCWLRSMAPRDAFFAGIAAGLAMGTKTVWIILPAIWLPLWIVVGCVMLRKGNASGENKTQARQIFRTLFGQPLLAGVTCLLTLNSLYGFENCGKPLGKYQFVSQSLQGEPDQESDNRFQKTILSRLPIPLPESFVQGIDEQRRDFESAQGGYLWGQHHEGGVWYYYLAAMLVKEPVCLLLLMGVATILAGVAIFRKSSLDSAVRLSLWVAGFHGLAILILVSWQSGLNSFYRYLLPAFPFAFLAIGLLAATGGRIRIARTLAVLLVIGAAVESMTIWPHSLSFFNLACGGPRHGGCYLLGSNLDWGQDLSELQRWQQDHPDAKPLYLIYDNFTPVEPYTIDWQPPPFLDEIRNYAKDKIPDALTGPPPPGWYAVCPNYIYQPGSPSMLIDQTMPHCIPHHREWFRTAKCQEFPGYGLLLFHVPDDQPPAEQLMTRPSRE